MFATHHTSILSRLKSAPLLRKLRIYGPVEHCLTPDKTFFSSLPKSIDLEFVYYPESSSPALSEILSLPHFRSITFDLTSRSPSQFGHLLGLDEFCLPLSRIEPKSPIIIHLPITESTLKLDVIKAVLGDKLLIHTFPSEKGLLDDFLAPYFDFDFPLDYDEGLEDKDDDDDEYEDEYEFEWGYALEHESEDEFEDEFGDEIIW